MFSHGFSGLGIHFEIQFIQKGGFLGGRGGLGLCAAITSCYKKCKGMESSKMVYFHVKYIFQTIDEKNVNLTCSTG